MLPYIGPLQNSFCNGCLGQFGAGAHNRKLRRARTRPPAALAIPLHPNGGWTMNLYPTCLRRCLAALLLSLAAACASTVSIKDILANPRAYAERTVSIEGEVTGMFSLVVVKYFTVNDGTGSINVVTDRPLPAKGQRIKVTGKVNELFSLGTETVLVLIEEPGGEGKSPNAGGAAK
jgi:hypothetical protein